MTEKTCNTCETDSCTTKDQKPEERSEEVMDRQALQSRMSKIKNKILVLSGKGGVGKSTVAANMAISLGLAGKRVGLLDVDIHGPSIPKLLHLEDRTLTATEEVIIPIALSDNLKVVSLGLILRGKDDAVIWRGPMKMGVIKQFLKDVEWGELDYLIIDLPPGTGDEPLSVCQLIEKADGAVVVTTPQEVALADVRKSINFCHALKLPVLGVVENMSGFICPKCNEITEIFKSGGGERMAEDMKVPFLGRIPLDPQIVEACDSGRPYVYHYARTETAKAFERVIRPILEMNESNTTESNTTTHNTANPKTEDLKEKEEKSLRIAIPIAAGRLAMHFGHCEEFALIDVDPDKKEILNKEMVAAPEHQPGLLPRWLAERGAQVIIAGGMGQRALNLFSENNIKVQIGAPAEPPEAIVKSYLNGTLKTGENICDH